MSNSEYQDNYLLNKLQPNRKCLRLVTLIQKILV